VSTSISDSNMAPEKTQSPIRYPRDLIDEEWEILQPVFDELEPYTTGRPRTTDLREILNAIFLSEQNRLFMVLPPNRLSPLLTG